MKEKKKPAGNASRGRPSTFSQQLADRICDRLATGESLRAICRDDAMPPESTVRRWVLDNEDFAAQYARAREAGYQCMADEILEISDDKEGDPSRDRLRVDTRKWLLSKCLPKIYGDKLLHAGADGGAITVELVRFSGASDA